MSGNARVTLPLEPARQPRLLSAHTETSGTTLVVQMIGEAYNQLGLPAREGLDWKAPDATPEHYDYERRARIP